jgi:NAD(P)-dependent dehydrogenase (short-subunit alcohol dehydrogenase family)
MGKTILVTGKEGFLGSEISQHFLNLGHRVAVSVPPRKEAFPSVDQDHTLLQFPWTRRSAVASKNFLLQTVQEFEALDEAWVIITPDREAFGLTELAPLVVDEVLDTGLKGTLYLVRELLQYQAAHSSMVLKFVFYDEDPATLPPVAAVQYQGLKGLVTSLLLQSRKRHLPIWAFESTVPRIEEYLSYVLTSKTTLAGQWNVLGPKKTLMNALFGGAVRS